MSDEKNTVGMNEEGQTLDIDQAKNMTIGEAVRKDSELKAGVTEEDSVLDKYIKQHRDQVASQKFDTKVMEAESLDTATLDNFIKKQREELAASGIFATEGAETLVEADEKTASQEAANEQTAVEESTPAEAAVSEPNVKESQTNAFENPDHFNDKEIQQKGSKKKLVGILLALLVLVSGLFFAVNAFRGQDNNKDKTASSAQQSTKESSKTTAAKKAKANLKSYNSDLKAFYSDAEMTKLKNSQFDKFDDLAKSLDKLKNTSYYEDAKSKFDLLKKQIDAVKAVNAKFATEAIKDGEKVSATIKSGANFDDIKADVLKTGNASLDKLLQSAIADGRKQIDDKAKAEKEKAAKEAENKAAESTDSAQAAAGQESTQGGAAASQTAPAQTAPAQAPTISGSGSGLTNANGIQRNLSRVPYNDAAIADTTNPAWLFNPGILEKVIGTAQARGYITGNNYYLEPVNIVNGNGYYNLFKPDGTYLFSINCKTGYFVGNAKGHADGLDY